MLGSPQLVIHPEINEAVGIILTNSFTTELLLIFPFLILHIMANGRMKINNKTIKRETESTST